jgi:hypothetical protein
LSTSSLPRTPHYYDVDAGRFRNEILPAGKPAILKGLVADWPAVVAGRRSDEALVAYLDAMDSGAPVNVLSASANIDGRFFYSPDLRGLNFERDDMPLARALAALLELRPVVRPPAIAVQSTPTPGLLPGFAEANRLALVGPEVAPRIWIGNAITTATHFDMSYNIACAVAGRRRFTLFPPDQLKNLYLGPFDFTPAGPPVSLVDVARPDLDRYPAYATALAAAEVAELEPGDAIYIPYCWFHNVESLDPFTVLINYWWSETPALLGPPLTALVHAMASVRGLPPVEREVWREMFDHFVFETHGDPAAHLPPDRRGPLGEMTPQHVARLRAVLSEAFNSP